MAIHDLSLTLSPELAVYEGDPPIQIKTTTGMNGGCTRFSEIRMGVHSGTHIDAPKHFFPEGTSIDHLDLEIINGKVRVVDTRGCAMITRTVLDRLKLPPDDNRMLFLTDNTTRSILHAPSFIKDFVAIDSTGASWLTEKNVRLVGIDAFSVAPYDAPDLTHQILLNHGTVLIEGVDLAGIEPGLYSLVAAPLKIGNGDGAPARVFLCDL
jgi:arylformamidase